MAKALPCSKDSSVLGFFVCYDLHYKPLAGSSSSSEESSLAWQNGPGKYGYLGDNWLMTAPLQIVFPKRRVDITVLEAAVMSHVKFSRDYKRDSYLPQTNLFLPQLESLTFT